MTAMESENTLASKCLDLCQMLASQGQAFAFTVTIGSTFNFSMSSCSQESPAAKAKGEMKKKSPSTRRRDARRRKEFLKRNDSSDVTLAGKDAQPVREDKEKTFKCDQCENIFKSENGLKIHIGKAHKGVNLPSPPEQLRSSHEGSLDIPISPLLDVRREEPSHNSDSKVLVEQCKNCDTELDMDWCCASDKMLCPDCCSDRLEVCDKYL